MLTNNYPLISVIVPAYNHQDYIQQTLRSIIAQTYPNLELIIINDGSKDNTDAKIIEMLPECRKILAHVEYINRENRGVVNTINQALDMIKGEFFYTVASDDAAKPNAVETFYNVIKQDDGIAIVCGDCELIDSTGKRVYWDEKQNIVPLSKASFKTFAEYLKNKRKDVDFSSDNYGSYKTLIKSNYLTSGLFRTSAVIAVGKYDSRFKIEDWYMALQLSKKNKIKFVDEILFSYRWHETNTVKNIEFMRQEMYSILENEKAYCCANGLGYIFLKRRIKAIKNWLFTIKIKKNKKFIKLFGITFFDK